MDVYLQEPHLKTQDKFYCNLAKKDFALFCPWEQGRVVQRKKKKKGSLFCISTEKGSLAGVKAHYHLVAQVETPMANY